MPRNRVRDPRGGVEGVARAAHGHEDPPQLPVGVQTGREQAPGILMIFSIISNDFFNNFYNYFPIISNDFLQ